MVMGNRAPNKLEWRIHVRNGTSEILQPETGLVHRVWSWLKGLLGEFMLKIWNFLEKARNIAVAEPKKVIHCLKGTSPNNITRHALQLKIINSVMERQFTVDYAKRPHASFLMACKATKI